MRQIKVDEEKDRKDQLEQKGLQGEIKDIFIDYKEEALKTFIDLLEGRIDIGNIAVDRSIFQRLLDKIGSNHFDNNLGTFSLEYAESRGNLNKEQAFFYLALYQFSVSRQFLLRTYLSATTEKHPDLLRLRHLDYIKNEFSYFSTPYVPKSYSKLEEEIKEGSKPYKILNAFYAIDDFKENLPHSSAYLVL